MGPATAAPAQTAEAPAGPAALDLPGLENWLSNREWKAEAVDLKQVVFCDRASAPVSLAKWMWWSSAKREGGQANLPEEGKGCEPVEMELWPRRGSQKSKTIFRSLPGSTGRDSKRWEPPPSSSPSMPWPECKPGLAEAHQIREDDPEREIKHFVCRLQALLGHVYLNVSQAKACGWRSG